MDDRSPSTRRFWVITALYLLVAAAWVAYTGTRPNAAPLNLTELADLLAGLFSPLAFLWLLYAALAQRAELQLQREELRQNNETQAGQQAQMQRQADALDAQSARLQAQADATYQPIFVLVNAAHPEGRVHLELANVGASVMDVEASPLRITKYFPDYARDVNIHGNIVSHWLTNARVYIGADGDAYRGDFEFEIEFTRLDFEHRRLTLKYIKREERVELVGIKKWQPEEPP